MSEHDETRVRDALRYKQSLDPSKPVEIRAWIQLGSERRETVIEIPQDEFDGGKRWASEEPNRSLDAWLENYVLDWLHAQYGWGWSGAGYENDFGFMQGSDMGGHGGLAVTQESSIPNTRAWRLSASPERE